MNICFSQQFLNQWFLNLFHVNTDWNHFKGTLPKRRDRSPDDLYLRSTLAGDGKPNRMLFLHLLSIHFTSAVHPGTRNWLLAGLGVTIRVNFLPQADAISNIHLNILWIVSTPNWNFRGTFRKYLAVLQILSMLGWSYSIIFERNWNIFDLT